MVLFTDLNQAPRPYLMLQHIGRVATLKLLPSNYFRYLQTTLIMKGGDLCLNLCELLHKEINEKKEALKYFGIIFKLKLTILDFCDIANYFMTKSVTLRPL